MWDLEFPLPMSETLPFTDRKLGRMRWGFDVSGHGTEGEKSVSKVEILLTLLLLLWTQQKDSLFTSSDVRLHLLSARPSQQTEVSRDAPGNLGPESSHSGSGTHECPLPGRSESGQPVDGSESVPYRRARHSCPPTSKRGLCPRHFRTQ